MAGRDINARWQEEMKSFFAALEGRRPDESFIRLEEVFHLD
jgi:L-rhamnose mutarotase